MAIANSRVQVLSAIRGAQAMIPDLWMIHPPGWTEAVNLHVEQMRVDINGWFESLLPFNWRKVDALKKADFGYFAATWYPKASYPELRLACYLSAWIFLWDDGNPRKSGANLTDTTRHKSYIVAQDLIVLIEFDEAIATNDFDAAEIYRTATMKFVSHCLLSDDQSPAADEGFGLDKMKILLAFKSAIAKPMRELYDRPRREILLAEIAYYVKGVQAEQLLQRRDTIPSIEEYCTYRMASSAVRFVLCVNEAVCKVRLPLKILTGPEMSALWNAATQHIWLVNDLFSSKKEVAQGNASLIPLLFSAADGDLQTAVDVIVEAVGVSIGNFEESADRLKSLVGDDEDAPKALEEYLDCCRSNCTGNLGWSLMTGRYGMGKVEGTHDGIRFLHI